MQLLTQGRIFLNNADCHKWIYLRAIFLEIFICATLLSGTFFCLFHYLDNRFLTIGYKFFTEVVLVNKIFNERSYCRDPNYSSGGNTPGTRKSCNLNLMTYQKLAMIALWYVYLIGAILLVLQITKRFLAFITCQQKR